MWCCARVWHRPAEESLRCKIPRSCVMAWRMPTSFQCLAPHHGAFLFQKDSVRRSPPIQKKEVQKPCWPLHIPPLTDLNLWHPWMPPRPCLDPSSTPHEHVPSRTLTQAMLQMMHLCIRILPRTCACASFRALHSLSSLS